MWAVSTELGARWAPGAHRPSGTLLYSLGRLTLECRLGLDA